MPNDNPLRLPDLGLIIGTTGTGKSQHTAILAASAAFAPSLHNGQMLPTKEGRIFFVTNGKEPMLNQYTPIDLRNKKAMAAFTHGIRHVNALDYGDNKVRTAVNIEDEDGHIIDTKEKDISTDVFYYVKKFVRDSVVVFDDYRDYHDSNQISTWLQKMATARKQYKNDYYFSAHLPGLVHTRLFGYANKIILHRTEGWERNKATTPKSLIPLIEQTNKATTQNRYCFTVIEGGKSTFYNPHEITQWEEILKP